MITNIPHQVKIKEDKEYFSSEKSKIFLPITYVMKDTSRKRDINSGDKDAVGHREDVHMSATASKANNPHNLIVGSAVQYMDFEQYGVIKWIGTIPGTKDTYAGVEMVCTWLQRKFESRLIFCCRKIMLMIVSGKMEFGEELNTSVVSQAKGNL